MNGLIWICILMLIIAGCFKKTNISQGGIYCFLLLVLGVLLSYDTPLFYKTIVFSPIAFVMYIMIEKTNVNTIIKAANPIYITSVVLLFAALIFPIINGVHRYIVLGTLALEPSVFIVFSVLPIAKIINRMERINMQTFFSIAMIFMIQVFAALMQPNLTPIVTMALVYLVLLFKTKIDKRIKMSWSIPMFVIAIIIFPIVMMFVAAPYRFERILDLLSWGEVDTLGVNYFLHNVKESLFHAKLIGSANVDFDNSILFGENSKYVLVYITLKYGWLCLVAVLMSIFMFISNLYKMSNKIDNSFARYSAFAFTTYFFVNALLHSISEFFLPAVNFNMPFMSNPTSIIIDVVILGLIINVYKNRENILVGRQLDVDYDSTDELLMSIEKDYVEKLENLDETVYVEEVKIIKDNITEVRDVREQWKNNSTSHADVTETFTKYWAKQGAESERDKNLIFISFNRNDTKCADFISRTLEEKGHKTWHYKKDMGPTMNTNAYPKAITEAIKNSKIVIIILSENSVKSMHVKNEICLSCAEEGNGTLIMPIKIDDVDISDEIYYYLCRQDIACIVPPDEDELLDFVEKVHEALRKYREKTAKNFEG